MENLHQDTDNKRTEDTGVCPDLSASSTPPLLQLPVIPLGWGLFQVDLLQHQRRAWAWASGVLSKESLQGKAMPPFILWYLGLIPTLEVGYLGGEKHFHRKVSFLPQASYLPTETNPLVRGRLLKSVKGHCQEGRFIIFKPFQGHPNTALPPTFFGW